MKSYDDKDGVCQCPECVKARKTEPLPVRSESTGWVLLDAAEWHNVTASLTRVGESDSTLENLITTRDKIEAQLRKPNASG